MDIDIKKIEEGQEYAKKIYCMQSGSFLGESYIAGINNSIEEFSNDINSIEGTHRGLAQEGGFIQEKWHADTLNINEKVKGVKLPNNHTNDLNSYASPDVTLSNGQTVSAKSYATPRITANEQAISHMDAYKKYLANATSRGTKNPLSLDEYLKKNNISEFKLDASKYENQIRIVPSDQYDFITIKYFHEIDKAIKNNDNKKAERLIEALNNTKYKLEGKNGASSIPNTRRGYMKVASDAQSGNFNPKKYGISLNELVSPADICKASVKAGFTAAAISASIQLVPTIYHAIDYLSNYGEINLQQSLKDGTLMITNAGESFLLGFMSCAIHSAFETANLSVMACNIAPAAIGIAAVFCLNTIKYSYELATGRITAREMEYQITKQLIIAGCGIAGGAIAIAIAPEANVIAFAIGSVIGSLIATTAFFLGERVLMAFCLDTGYSLFGIVDQNYEMSEEMIKDIGIDVAELTFLEESCHTESILKETVIEENIVNENIIDFKVYKRGIIGFAKIGYLY